MERPGSSAVDKALDLIEAVARSDRPLRLTDLADHLGMHRATAYRVLVDLVRRGWVLRFGDRYLPGTAVLQLSRTAAGSSLTVLSQQVLEELSEQTGMMTNLQVLEADGSRVLSVVRPTRYALIADLAGELLAVHKFAGPLALVAALDDAGAEHYLSLAARSGYPVEGLTGLRADLARTRERGYAVVRRRRQDVVASVSEVVRGETGQPLCAVAVVGLDNELDDDTLETVVAHLSRSVEALQKVLINPGS